MLILRPLEDEVMHWLSGRHTLRIAPHLAHDRAAFLDSLSDVRGVIAAPGVRLDARALLHAPLLRAVGSVSDAAEHIDSAACERAGVAVVRAVSATAQAEAEFMVGALLQLLRRVPGACVDGHRVGRELGSLTVGLIGMAPSARSTAKLLTAFGANVLGYEPSVHANAGVWERWGARPAPLRELLATCDAVCIQLGYFSRYRGLLGERLLPLCKRDQVLVSISHADVFDETVLADSLRSGRIGAAWLDSVAPGALEPGRPLHGLHSLQVTPRLASSTRESRLRSAWSVARQIDAVLSPTSSPEASAHTRAAA